MLFDRYISILVRRLLNSIWNTSVSVVKFSWTSLYSVMVISEKFSMRKVFTRKEEVDEVHEAAGPRAPDLHADADPVPVKVVQEVVVVSVTVVVLVVVDVHDHGLWLEPLGHLGRDLIIRSCRDHHH